MSERLMSRLDWRSAVRRTFTAAAISALAVSSLTFSQEPASAATLPPISDVADQLAAHAEEPDEGAVPDTEPGSPGGTSTTQTDTAEPEKEPVDPARPLTDSRAQVDTDRDSAATDTPQPDKPSPGQEEQESPMHRSAPEAPAAGAAPGGLSLKAAATCKLRESETPGETGNNDSRSDADSVALGSTICGKLSDIDDRDTFKFNATAGTYSVALSFSNAYDAASTHYFTVAVADANEKTLKTWKILARDWKGKSTSVKLPSGAAFATVTAGTSAFVGETYKLKISASKPAPKPAFVAVLASHKFYKEIQWMSSSGLSTGVKTSKGQAYQPNSSASRQAMAAFLYRQTAPKNFKTPKVSPFADVPTTHKFYKEIAWMAEAKISTGYKKGTKRYYQPTAAVSRQGMAAFLYRLHGAGSGKAPATAPFVDVPKTHKYAKEIAWMKSKGISTGSKSAKGTVYKPNAPVTRAEMAAFLFRSSK